MRRALSLLSFEVRGMHAAAYVLALSALGSSLLALVRDRLLASTFGAGPELDVYYAAFRVPDILFVSVASLFSAYVLIPELARRDAQGQRAYIDTVLVWFSVMMVALCALLYATMPTVLHALFPTLMASQGALMLLMSRLLLLQPFFLGVSNIFAAVTQYEHRYLLYALAPIVYNVGIVIGILVFLPLYGIVGIVYGVLCGALFHALIQVPPLVKSGYVQIRVRESVLSVWKTAELSLPRTLALSASHALVLVLIALAARLSEGSVAVFTLAFNLQSVPLAIIGASYSVAAFPTLAKMLAEGDKFSFVRNVGDAARHILFWSLPFAGLIIVLRAHIVRVVLGGGEFNWTDTRLTAAVLAVFAVAVVAQAVTLLLMRAYYAAGRSLLPFIVGVGSSVVAAGLSVALLEGFAVPSFVRFVGELLRVESVAGVEVVALAIGYTCGSLLVAGLLLAFFERDFGGLTGPLARTFSEALSAAGVAGFVAYGVLDVLGGISAATTLWAVVMHGIAAGVAGVGAAIFTYLLVGNREIFEVYQAITRRVAPKDPVLSAEEQLA